MPRNIAGSFRERVARLREALPEEVGPEIVEAIRALIARVEVHPPAEGSKQARVELIGHLAAMLRAAGVGDADGLGTAKSPPAGPGGLDLFWSSESVDAGTGFEPVTFRL